MGHRFLGQDRVQGKSRDSKDWPVWVLATYYLGKVVKPL